ncbi:MAG: hypothetical protein WBD31_12350 [Rubripirellula sp.]
MVKSTTFLIATLAFALLILGFVIPQQETVFFKVDSLPHQFIGTISQAREASGLITAPSPSNKTNGDK